jgi:hypothetical protein
MVRRIHLDEVRPGDVLVYKRGGLVADVLSWLIWKLKEPKWDRWGWHTAPVVALALPYYYDRLAIALGKTKGELYRELGEADGSPIVVSAECPKLVLRKAAGDVRAYRITEVMPSTALSMKVVTDHVGHRYDFLVYFLTALAVLLRPHIDFPRIINKVYDCWEVTWSAADTWEADITTEYNYPWLCDLLRLCGECR